MRKDDLVGRRFGKLTVVSDSDIPDTRGNFIHVNCVCDCGNKTRVAKSSLKGNKKNGTSTKSCGCLKKTHFIDLTGQKFNILTAKRYLGKDNSKNNIYEWTCDCGSSIIAQGSDIKTGKIKSCGCKSNSDQIKNAKSRGIETLIRSLFAGYKRDRGYEFSITYEYFKDIISKNCHYCGSEPSNVKKDKRSFGDRVLKYNGIDRIDNDKGYTEENTVPCCRNCNIAKHTYTVEFFKELVTKIYHNFVMKGKNEEKSN